MQEKQSHTGRERMEAVRGEAFINLALRQFTHASHVQDFLKAISAANTRETLLKQIVPDTETRGPFSMRPSSEGPYLSERSAGPREAPLEVHFTTPEGSERQFRLIHATYDPTTGFKGLAFRELGADRVKILFPGSHYNWPDNLAILDTVLGDTLNHQVKKERDFTQKVMEKVDARNTKIDVVGVSLGSQSSVMALMHLVEKYQAGDASLMLVEGFLPGMAMKYGCQKLAERKRGQGLSTSPLEEAEKLSSRITQVDIHPDTVVGYWPFGTQPGHCVDIGKEKYDVLVNPRPRTLEGVMRAWIHDHTPTTVGLMLYPGNAVMRPSEAPTPLEDLFSHKSAQRHMGPLGVQGQIAITRWFCEQLGQALGALVQATLGRSHQEKIQQSDPSSTLER